MGGIEEREIRFRHAVAADAGRLSRFAATVFEETFAGTYDPPDMEKYLGEAFAPAIQAAEIAEPALSIVLAESDGQIVGYMQLSDDPTGDQTELNRIYLAVEQRGTGLAARLLAIALEETAQRRRSRVWLSVWYRNHRAIAFYRKHGFALCGETGFEWGEGIEKGLVMERRL